MDPENLSPQELRFAAQTMLDSIPSMLNATPRTRESFDAAYQALSNCGVDSPQAAMLGMIKVVEVAMSDPRTQDAILRQAGKHRPELVRELDKLARATDKTNVGGGWSKP